MPDFSVIARLDQMNAMNKNTLMEQIGIEYTELGENFICGTMPVNHKTHQPMGLLHGGASCVLAESLGSIGSAMLAGKDYNITGIEINANHVKGKREGMVKGKAVLIHHGRTTHVWQIDITDEEKKLVCTSRLTVLVVPKNEALSKQK